MTLVDSTIVDLQLNELLVGYSGLSIAFILLSAVMLWMLFGVRGKVLLKALLTTFIVWYSVALFFSIQNLTGWPTTTTLENMRTKSDLQVLSIQIRPPDKRVKGDIGSMYFWTSIYGSEDLEYDVFDLINPMKAFDYKYKKDPRAYKIPYDEELHKEIIEKAKKKGGIRGSIMLLKKKEKNKKKGGDKDLPRLLEEEEEEKNRFKIINPYELMKK